MLGRCLEGIKVLDLSQYIPGPFATRMLGDLGAEVVKVEPPAGDPMRRFLLRDGDGISPLYKEINGGKRILSLDLKSEAGRSRFAELAAGADVLLESYRPGVLERLGFGRERLRTLNPRLIHAALSGFGQNGPYRHRAGHDLTYMAMSGGLNGTGTAAKPVMTFPPLADHAGAMQAAVAILGALLQRERSGEGAHLDLSLFEAALSWQALGLNGQLRDSSLIGRDEGLLNGGAACYHVYRTGDGRFMALAALEPVFWERFCRRVGRSDWIARQGDPLPQEDLIDQLRSLFGQLTFDEWCGLAESVDCCLEPVLDYNEVTEHAQVRHRCLLQEKEGDEPRREVLFPAWVDGHPPGERRPPCTTSADEVLARWRGASSGAEGGKMSAADDSGIRAAAPSP